MNLCQQISVRRKRLFAIGLAALIASAATLWLVQTDQRDTRLAENLIYPSVGAAPPSFPRQQLDWREWGDNQTHKLDERYSQHTRATAGLAHHGDYANQTNADGHSAFNHATKGQLKKGLWCQEEEDVCEATVVLLCVIVLVAAFLGLAIVCDDFLVPPIEHFCRLYQIPDEAAGASFLAFGSSAPEIVIASIATLGGPDENGADAASSETGLSTVLGSAVLAFGLIPAVCAIIAPPPASKESPRCAPPDPEFGGYSGEWVDKDILPLELAQGGLLLDTAPLVRDVCFAICGMALVFVFGNDGVVVRWEALVLVCGFFAYMVVVFVPAAKKSTSACRAHQLDQGKDIQLKHLPLLQSSVQAYGDLRPLFPTPSSVQTSHGNCDRVMKNTSGADACNPSNSPQRRMRIEEDGSSEEAVQRCSVECAAKNDFQADDAEGENNRREPASQGCLLPLLSKGIDMLRKPIEWICEHTIPHEPATGQATSRWLGCVEVRWNDNLGYPMLGFTISLLYVSVLADVILEAAKYCCDRIGMSDDLEGLTVLAWGAQVPDTLTSVAMAKKGMGAGAVANAVGSQIINVFIGLGLPYAIAGSSPLNTQDAKFMVVCLLICMASFVGVTSWAMFCPLPACLGGTARFGSGTVGTSRRTPLATRPILTPQAGKLLVAIWALCNVLIIVTDRESSWDLLGPSFTAPRPWDYMV